MSLRRHHAAPALEVSVLGVAAGVSKGRCAATTRPLPSASHTSISTSSGVVPRVAHQRCAAADTARRGRRRAPRPTPRAAANTVRRGRAPCCRRHWRARAAAAATAAVHRSYGAARGVGACYGDESSTCQRSLVLSGLSPRLLLQRHKVCTALRRLVLTYFTEHSACLFLLFFFIQYAHAFFPRFGLA